MGEMMLVLHRVVLVSVSLLLGACGTSPPRECVAPAMVERCAEGFCEVPAGCQTIQPIPKGWPCSEMVSRLPMRRVWITRSFMIQQREMSAGKLASFGLPEAEQTHVSTIRKCEAKDCPAVVDWGVAAAACNELSREEGRELCYECRAQPNGRWACSHGSASSFFGCRGYRLPSYGEWQYAVFAGEVHPLITGVERSASCQLALWDDRAWHSDNANRKLQGRGLKRQNPLGLFDVFGNVNEWCDDHVPPLLQRAHESSDYEEVTRLRAEFDQQMAREQTDPLWMVKGGMHAVSMGGSVNGGVIQLEPAAYQFPRTVVPQGIRCVRTLEP
jgi:formylglycine-generating enzyme required for sulfatase activity